MPHDVEVKTGDAARRRPRTPPPRIPTTYGAPPAARLGPRRPGGSASAAGTSRFSPYVYISPFFILFLIVGMFPLVYTAVVSVYDWSLIGGKGEFVGLQNYRDVLDEPVLLEVGRQHHQHLPALLGPADR